MSEKVIRLDRMKPSAEMLAHPERWFALVDARLGRIERIVNHLVWQVWLIVCGAAGLMLIEVLRLLAPH